MDFSCDLFPRGDKTGKEEREAGVFSQTYFVFLNQQKKNLLSTFVKSFTPERKHRS